MTIWGGNGNLLLSTTITVLLCGALMYFCHTRLQIVENAVIKQNQVLASFIANVQNDIRGTWATPEALSAAKFAYAQDEGLGAAGPLASAAGPLASAAGASAAGPLAEPQMTNINPVVLASNKSNEEKTNFLSNTSSTNIVLKKIDVSDDDSSDSCDTSSEDDESSSEEEEEDTKSFSGPASFGGMASFSGPSLLASFGGPNGFNGPNGFGNSTFIEVGDNNFIQTGGMKIIDLSSNHGFHLSSMFANLLNQQSNQSDTDDIQLSGIEEIPDHESNKITLDPGVFDVQSVDVQVLDAQGLDVQSLDVQSLDGQSLGIDLGVQSLDAPKPTPLAAPVAAPLAAPLAAAAPVAAPISFSTLTQMKVDDLRQHAINVGVVAKEQSRKLKKNELLAFFK